MNSLSQLSLWCVRLESLIENEKKKVRFYSALKASQILLQHGQLRMGKGRNYKPLMINYPPD
jgi:hypothetical protein